MFSNESSLLMDHMFEEDSIMERLRHEGLNNLHDNMDRQSDGITMLDGPRDVATLVACPWKSRGLLLHCLAET